MAFRFAKSVKIAPGLKVNFGKRGVSLSAGVKGASVRVGSQGTYSNVSIPGTGISYRSRIDGSPRAKGARRQQQRIDRQLQRLEEEMRRQEALSEIKLTLDKESGTIQIQNTFGEPLSQGDLKFLWNQKGSEILEWLKLQAEEINGDVELLVKIHEDTPSPDSEPDYQIIPFGDKPPSEPKPPEERAKPELEILPSLSFLARLFKRKREAHAERQQQLQDEHNRQIRAWEEQRKAQYNNYHAEVKAHEDARERWEKRKIEHETIEKEREKEFSKQLRTDPDLMDSILEKALNSLSWPRETAVSYEIVDHGRQVWLDVDLPEIEDLPQKIASLASNGKKLNIKNKSQKQLQLEYAAHIHGIAFRLAGTVFAALPTAQVSIISGYSQRLDKSTGKVGDEYLFSTKVGRERYSRIDFDSLNKVNPIEAMCVFESRCKMTTTGIFKVIEPFQPESK